MKCVVLSILEVSVSTFQNAEIFYKLKFASLDMLKGHILKRSSVPILMSLFQNRTVFLCCPATSIFIKRTLKSMIRCFPNVPEDINHQNSGPKPDQLNLQLNETGFVVYVFTKHLSVCYPDASL